MGVYHPTINFFVWVFYHHITIHIRFLARPCVLRCFYQVLLIRQVCVFNKGLPGACCSRKYLMVSVFHSALQFQLIVTTSARKIRILHGKRFPWWGCSCEANFWRNQRHTRLFPWQEKEIHFGRPHSFFLDVAQSYRAVKMLLPDFQSLVVMPVQHQNDLKRNLRLPCARLAFTTGFAEKQIW